MWNTSGKEKVKSLSFWKVPTNNNQKQFAFLFRNFSLSLFPVFSMLKWLCKVRLNTTQLKFLPPLQSRGLSFCPFSGLGRWIPPSRCDQHPLLDWGTPARPPAVAGQGAHTDGFSTQSYFLSVITWPHTHARFSVCLWSFITGSRRFCILYCVQLSSPCCPDSPAHRTISVTASSNYTAKVKDMQKR